MTSTVTRLYKNRETAAQAVEALKKRGFKNHHIEVVETAEVPHALHRAGLTRARAEDTARNAGPGATAVLVRAPFGAANAALNALDPFDAVDLRRAARPGYRHEDNPSPLSDAMGMKVLIRNNPAPLSHALGLALLSEKQNPDIKLSHEPAPFSKALGMATLSRKQNPDIKLSHNPAPLSDALGLPVLLRDDD